MRNLKRTLWGAFALTGLSLAARGQNADVINHGKQATALVEVTTPDGGKKSGTAFCVNGEGYFVTNHQVVADALKGAKVQLILAPGENDQKVLEATVVRDDEEDDLVLLKTVSEGTYPALVLGDDAGLIETQPVIAFGYPFGVELVKDEEFPSVSVSTGHITSLRRAKGELGLIQLDNSLNPGNSGGPVQDEQGRVIGIVQGGVPGAALNFAIPVSKLAAMLTKPDIALAPVSVPFAQRFEPVRLTAQVTNLYQKDAAYAVELSLPGEAGDRQVALKGENGVYTATAALLPSAAGGGLVDVTLGFAYGNVSGRVPDQAIKIGSQTVQLSAIAEVDNGENSTVLMQNGDTHPGPLPPTTLKLNLGGATITANLAQVTRLDVAPPAGFADYTLTVKSNGQVVAKKTGLITFADAPVAGPVRQEYDASADFAAGWAAAVTGQKNPAVVWTYGWSRDLHGSLVLYSEHKESTTVQGTADTYFDPENDNQGSPVVGKKLKGPDYDDGNSVSKAGQLGLGPGGLDGHSYSHVIWTAPANGTYTLTGGFIASQHNINVDVHVLLNGDPEFSGVLTQLGKTVPFTKTFSLKLGDTIDFAVGPNGNYSLHPANTVLEAHITRK